MLGWYVRKCYICVLFNQLNTTTMDILLIDGTHITCEFITFGLTKFKVDNSNKDYFISELVSITSTM